MKRTLALILSLAMVFALVACGQKEETPDDTKQPDEVIIMTDVSPRPALTMLRLAPAQLAVTSI